MTYMYAPGCALASYKPHLVEKLKMIITEKYGPMETLLTCCFNTPQLKSDTCIITPCATCAGRYAKMYPDSSSLFFLTDLVKSTTFPFPDYKGINMSIQDTCSARTQPETLETIRQLLKRMNIHLIEPARTGEKSKCCGQTFYGKLPVDKVESLMKSRAEEMPCKDVAVYCASCIMSMTVGGKRPRYILDLLFNEPTTMGNTGIIEWNTQLRNFRNQH